MKAITASKLLIASLLFAFVGSATAELLVEVERNPKELVFEGKRLLVDTDSIKADPETKSLYFTYRVVGPRAFGGGQSTLEYQAIGSCERFAITETKITSLGEYGSVIEERFVPGVGWKKPPLYMLQEASDISMYPKMLMMVCRSTYPELMAAMLSKEVDGGCAKPISAFEAEICRVKEINRINLRLLKQRIGFVADHCGNGQVLQAYFKEYLAAHQSCWFMDRCPQGEISELSPAVALDAQRIASRMILEGKEDVDTTGVCEAELKMEAALNAKRERQKKDAEKTKAREAFIRCTKKSISDIDDNKSDAATIAKAVFEICSGPTYDYLDASNATSISKQTLEQFQGALEASVIETVLKHRKRK